MINSKIKEQHKTFVDRCYCHREVLFQKMFVYSLPCMNNNSLAKQARGIEWNMPKYSRASCEEHVLECISPFWDIVSLQSWLILKSFIFTDFKILVKSLKSQGILTSSTSGNPACLVIVAPPISLHPRWSPSLPNGSTSTVCCFCSQKGLVSFRSSGCRLVTSTSVTSLAAPVTSTGPRTGRRCLCLWHRK